MMCCNPHFFGALICHFSALDHGLFIIHGIAKLANTFISQIWTLMTPFERYFSKLSENHKIVDIGYTEDPMSKILGFSESLERDLWNGVLQSKFFSGP